MLIMYLLGMLFHPANVLSLTFALEVKSCSALCGLFLFLVKLGFHAVIINVMNFTTLFNLALTYCEYP